MSTASPMQNCPVPTAAKTQQHDPGVTSRISESTSFLNCNAWSLATLDPQAHRKPWPGYRCDLSQNGFGVLCCVLCIVYCVLCIVYCVLCIVYCVLCIVYCVLCIVYCVLCIVVLLFCCFVGLLGCWVVGLLGCGLLDCWLGDCLMDVYDYKTSAMQRQSLTNSSPV